MLYWPSRSPLNAFEVNLLDSIVSILETTPIARTYISLRKLDWRIVLGLIVLNTICLSSYRQLNYVSNALSRSPLLTFSEEAVGGLAGLVVFPLIYLMAIRFPLISPKWRFNLVAHLVAVCFISIIHTTVIALARMVVFPLLGVGNESYGYLPARYPMEFSHLFIYYWVALSFIYLFHEIRFAREREVFQAKLEINLAEAQLENLRLQLEPHFLFNALNTISALIYENPRVADEMIGRLGELLRQLLKEDRSQLIPLSREVEILQLYTRIMEARFEDRLTVRIEFDDVVGRALVPQLIFQPLVENAIRYGMDSHFEVRIAIQARREGRSLRLTVRDHGPGIDVSAPPKMGIGFGNTVERLQRLYGTNQSLKVFNAPDGGTVVEICLPLQVDDEREPSAELPLAVARGVQ